MNKYLLLLISMCTSLTGELLFKQGMTNATLKLEPLSIIKTIFSPYIFFGFVCFGSGAILWLFVLQRFPLSIAYPMLALNYVFVIFLSALFFGEQITVYKVAGVLLIILGVFLLYRSS